MTGRPVAVLAIDRDAELPPGIERAGELAELRRVAPSDDPVRALADADALFAWDADPVWLERGVAAAATLRWMQTVSDGVDDVLVPALVARDDVVVTNARGVFEEPIAEWAIGAMLAMVTGLHRSIVDQQARIWGHGRHTERLAGLHLVLVGPGPIGRATARRAVALGMTVGAVGRSPREDPVLGTVVGSDGFHAALAEADVVLDALPLTAATRRMFDAAAFAAMRPGARFLNVGRGGTVDEEALVEALRSGRLGGAALDVFETEPLPAEHPLWTLPGVIVSPHACGDVVGWEHDVVAIFLDNLDRFVRGAPLRNLVDVRAGFGVGEPVDA